MKSTSVYSRFFALVIAALVAVGCANQMKPAQKAIADIEAAVAAAGADAAKYIPDQLQSVNDQLANLKAMFDKKDYKGVLAGAPAVLTAAQSLASDASAKKTEAMDALNGEWTTLSASVPQAISAIQSRVDILSKAKKLPAGMDAATLDSVKTGLADATNSWSQATAAQASGDIEQAVTLARDVKSKADGMLSQLGMTPS